MSDASEYAVGYKLLIGDYARENTASSKTCTPVVFAFRRFTASRTSSTIYAIEFLVMIFAFEEIGQVKKPKMVMTGSKALTRFFQAKQILLKFWNFCDYVHQFIFVLTHVPGIENLAPSYLTSLDVASTERIHLKLIDSIPILHIEIYLASQTPKQDNDEKDFTRQCNNPKPNTEDFIEILMIFTQRDGKSKDEYEHRLQLIRNQVI